MDANAHPRGPVTTTRDEVGSIGTQLDIRDLSRVRSLDDLNLLARLGVVLGHLAVLVTGKDVVGQWCPDGDSGF